MAEDRTQGFPFKRPRLAEHLYVRTDLSPTGNDILYFNSERRQIRLEGHRLRIFHDAVIPLLDGTRSIAEIHEKCSDLFRASDLDRALRLLHENNLLQDAALDIVPGERRIELAPQMNFLHELDVSADAVQERLSNSSVAIVGLGGAGAAAALALAAAGVGGIRCIDAGAVSPADPFLSPVFSRNDVGKSRAEVVSAAIRALCPATRAVAYAAALDSDEECLRILDGSDMAICCADPGLASLFYKVNHACLKLRLDWIACSVSAFEGIVGPMMRPFETACYMCCQMRAAACADKPEEAVSFLEFLDARRQDHGAVRENHGFGAATIGNLAGLEVFKALSRVAEPPTMGKAAILDFLKFSLEHHAVLRRPQCPACADQ